MLGSNAPRILSCKVPNRARRSALRAVFAMSQLPSAELSQELNNCIQTIQASDTERNAGTWRC